MTSSPQLSLLMLAGLIVACYLVWDLGQVLAQLIVERAKR